MDKDVLILAIESSCDETAAAVVKMAVMCCQILFIPRSSCTNYMVALYLKLHQENISRKSIRLLPQLWKRQK